MILLHKNAKFALLTTIVVIVVYNVLLLLICPSYWIRIPSDDALFYSIISTNTLNGYLSSFDGGISSTTGYHIGGMIVPLFVSSIVRLLFGVLSFRQAFPFHYVANTLVIVMYSMYLALYIKRFYGIFTTVSASFLAVLSSQIALLGFGMETVYSTCILLTLIAALRDRKPDIVKLVLLTTLCIISRYDTVILLAVIGISVPLLARQSRKRIIVILSSMSIGALGAVLLIAITNMSITGNIVPTSILVKSQGLNISFVSVLEQIAAMPHVVLAYIIVVSPVCKNKEYYNTLTMSLAVASLCSFLLIAILRSSGKNNLGSWYDVSWLTLLLVSLLVRFDQVLRTKPVHVAKLLLYVFVLIAIMPRHSLRLRFGVNHSSDNQYWSAFESLGEYIRTETDENAVLATDDLPGRVTYFSERQVIALDGLANSPDYVIRHLLTGSIGEYIADNAQFLVLFTREELQPNASDNSAVIGFLFNSSISESCIHFSKWEYMDVLREEPRILIFLVDINSILHLSSSQL